MPFARSIAAGHVGRWAAVLLLFSLPSGLIPTSAAGLEITCVEASRYKYLYEIFGGDSQRFADHFQVGTAKLPEGEMCRAILVTGHIEPHRSGHPDDDPDFDRLVEAIAANRGWLAEIYLASPGGTVGTAMRLAVLTRLFWLKTRAPGGPFVYVPDFLAAPGFAVRADEDASAAIANVPHELAAGWKAYSQAAAPHLRVPMPEGARGRCTSACTYPLVAGIDRLGTPFVHRGRRSAAARPAASSGTGEPSLAETVELLQRSEARVVALYRHMDAGDAIIRLFRSTATTTAAPAPMTRSPRFLADHLRRICKVDVNAPASARDPAIERCVGAAHERERLRQFERLCGRVCRADRLRPLVRKRLQELFAEFGPSAAP